MSVFYVLTAGAASAVLMPLVIFFCRRMEWFDPIDSRKLHRDKTPRLGSIGFVPVFLAVSLVYLWHGDRSLFWEVLPLFAAGTLIFIMGLMDDFMTHSALFKLVVQSVICVIPLLFKFRITQIGPLELHDFSLPFTFIWFLGLVNAFNLIDGLDAFCGSISFTVLCTYGLALLFFDSSVFYLVPFILCACIFGFLLWNKPKAKIFMGDGGSQFLGFMIAGLVLVETKDAMRFALLPFALVLCAIPVLDTFAAIWRRKRMGKSFYTADKLHLHHKLLRMGFTNKSILFFILSIQIGLCGIALLALVKLRNTAGLAVLCFAFLVAVTFFAIIHYIHQAVSKTLQMKNELFD